MNRSCNSILCRFGIHTADPYVNRIGQLTVSVLLNRFARKEHRE